MTEETDADGEPGAGRGESGPPPDVPGLDDDVVGHDEDDTGFGQDVPGFGSGSLAAEAYNYRHFDFDRDYVGRDRGVTPGDTAVGGTVYTIDGEAVAFSDLWADGPAVVEFGSITCPIFLEKSDRMDALAERYADEVTVAVLYVREAHPGHSLGPHQTLDSKLAAARECRAAAGIDRPIYVDEVGGAVHRAYGTLPNAVVVVGHDGIVSYRADWLDVDDLDAHLTDLLAAGSAGDAVEPTDREDNFHAPTLARARAMAGVTRRAGLDSLRDFLASSPAMLRHRIRNR